MDVVRIFLEYGCDVDARDNVRGPHYALHPLDMSRVVVRKESLTAATCFCSLEEPHCTMLFLEVGLALFAT